MHVRNVLETTVRQLEAAGIGTARLDTFVMLEDVTGKDRAWLLAHPEATLSAQQQVRLQKMCTQRSQHTPLAYVRGFTEFYGKNFVITPAVLEPRPESETMLDILLKLPDLPANACLADVGTGSGALGIMAKILLPDLNVELLEIDEAALSVAQNNVDKYTIDAHVIKSDLLAQSTQLNDVLLCNLPYVPDDHQVNQAAAQEPHIAIFGGPDGLDVYRRLLQQIVKLSLMPLYILCESLPNQHNALQVLMMPLGYELVEVEDFIQVFRHGPVYGSKTA